MTKKEKSKANVINVKVDDKTKSKIDLVAYLEDISKQDLGKKAIEEYLKKYDKKTIQKILDAKMKDI